MKFFKKIFIISIFLSANLSASEKNQIVTQLNNLNSLEFTFDQIINDKTEKGSCLLEFPGKLKCDYLDDKKKELIINKKRLAITQKRYNKTYYYPISKSPFLNILYKDKLLEIEHTPGLKEEIRNRAKNTIKDRFSISVVGKMWEDLLNEF